MALTTVLCERADGVATITLNRPDVLNSFNGEMADQFLATLKEVHDDRSIRAVLLTGAGKGFCAGQDLAEVTTVVGEGAELDLGKFVAERYNPIVQAVTEMPKPVVCAVNGSAAGAGASLAFLCDITYAAESASFIQAFAKIGLVPDTGASYFLPRLVGMNRAKALAFLAEKLSAADAQQMGLIYRVVPNDALLATARETAKTLAAMPTQALALTKQMFHAGMNNSLTDQLAVELEGQRSAGNTRDFSEGVQAFIEKRKPVFTGE